MTAEQQPQPEESSSNTGEVITYTAGGSVAGGLTSAVVGQMGLAVAGGAVSIGLLSMIGIGAVAGLAAYGLKRAIYD